MTAEGDKPSRAPRVRKRSRYSRFLDRADAGRELAQRLLGFDRREDCVVLALPRGGVPVALEVARALRLPLDILLARALSVPGHEAQMFGAIAADHGAVLDYALIRAAGLTPEQVSEAMDAARADLKARAKVLRKGRAPLDLTGKTVILVDDGSSTGASLFAGVHMLKRMRPAQVVVAVPVCPQAACARLEREADLLLALKRPEGFYAMAQFYLQLPTVSDMEVVQVLQNSPADGRKRPRRRTPKPVAAEDDQTSTGLSGCEP